MRNKFSLKKIILLISVVLPTLGGGERRMSLNQDDQPANEPINMDPPINQVCTGFPSIGFSVYFKNQRKET